MRTLLLVSATLATALASVSHVGTWCRLKVDLLNTQAASEFKTVRTSGSGGFSLAEITHYDGSPANLDAYEKRVLKDSLTSVKKSILPALYSHVVDREARERSQAQESQHDFFMNAIVCSRRAICPKEAPLTSVLAAVVQARDQYAPLLFNSYLEVATTDEPVMDFGAILESYEPNGKSEGRKLFDKFSAAVSFIDVAADPSLSSLRELDTILVIVAQTLEGLRLYRSRLAVQRDVKPANMFLDSKWGTVRLIDHGGAVITSDLVDLQQRLVKESDMRRKKGGAQQQQQALNGGLDEGIQLQQCADAAVQENELLAKCPFSAASTTPDYHNPKLTLFEQLTFKPGVYAMIKPHLNAIMGPDGAASLDAAFKKYSPRQPKSEWEEMMGFLGNKEDATTVPSKRDRCPSLQAQDSSDLFPAGMLLFRLLAGTSGHTIDELINFTCDRSGLAWGGSSLRFPAALKAYCKDSALDGATLLGKERQTMFLGEKNLALMKFVSLDAIAAPPTTPAEKEEAKKRLFTILHATASVSSSAATAFKHGAYNNLIQRERAAVPGWFGLDFDTSKVEDQKQLPAQSQPMLSSSHEGKSGQGQSENSGSFSGQDKKSLHNSFFSSKFRDTSASFSSSSSSALRKAQARGLRTDLVAAAAAATSLPLPQPPSVPPAGTAVAPPVEMISIGSEQTMSTEQARQRAIRLATAGTKKAILDRKARIEAVLNGTADSAAGSPAAARFAEAGIEELEGAWGASTAAASSIRKLSLFTNGPPVGVLVASSLSKPILPAIPPVVLPPAFTVREADRIAYAESDPGLALAPNVADMPYKVANEAEAGPLTLIDYFATPLLRIVTMKAGASNFEQRLRAMPIAEKPALIDLPAASKAPTLHLILSVLSRMLGLHYGQITIEEAQYQLEEARESLYEELVAGKLKHPLTSAVINGVKASALDSLRSLSSCTVTCRNTVAAMRQQVAAMNRDQIEAACRNYPAQRQQPASTRPGQVHSTAICDMVAQGLSSYQLLDENPSLPALVAAGLLPAPLTDSICARSVCQRYLPEPLRRSLQAAARNPQGNPQALQPSDGPKDPKIAAAVAATAASAKSARDAGAKQFTWLHFNALKGPVTKKKVVGIFSLSTNFDGKPRLITFDETVGADQRRQLVVAWAEGSRVKSSGVVTTTDALDRVDVCEKMKAKVAGTATEAAFFDLCGPTRTSGSQGGCVCVPLQAGNAVNILRLWIDDWSLAKTVIATANRALQDIRTAASSKLADIQRE